MSVRNRLSIVASVAAMMLAACSDSTTPAASSGGTPGNPDSGKTPTSDSGTPDGNKLDIIQTAAGAGTFKTLAELLTAADLVDTLKGAGPFTVLAPTDEAFAKLPAALVTALKDPANKALLKQILTYHVIGASVLAADVVKLTKAASIEGENLNISVADGKVVINKSTTSPAVVNNANVTATDIKATNGVIHVIDTVLASDIALLNLPTAIGSKDIVDTAVASSTAPTNPEFKTLVAALKSETLVDTLKGPGPFTVFAPTDAAFAKLTLNSENLPAKPALGPTLLYHVVPGIVGSAAVGALDGKDVVTVGKKTFKVKVMGTDVFLTDGSSPANDVKVIKTDIATKNGLIHVIDTVLTPPKS